VRPANGVLDRRGLIAAKGEQHYDHRQTAR
jgi:hypothetical protein